MAGLDYSTAGESHGPGLVILVHGFPSGVPIDVDAINAELARRQGGYGRGGRQNIEEDRVEILTGVRNSTSMGSPIAMLIRNRDSRLDDPIKTPPLTRPRPGHADLAGSVKHLTDDCRNILERASARETASRVAAGALARLLLRELGMDVFGFTRAIKGIATTATISEASWRDAKLLRDQSDTYCPDPAATQLHKDAIRQAKIDKDTLGGIIEAHAFNVPMGLGSCMDWRDKLDARLAFAAMSIQAIKGVEIGMGFAAANVPGSHVHDPILFDHALRDSASHLGFHRPTNNAGGTEGGMSNGMPIVVRAAMKPISTLLQGLPSVDLATLAPDRSQYERSDVCAVPAASVVLENVVAFEIARALRDKCAGDSLAETRGQLNLYLHNARNLPLVPPDARLA
jgi:chorismate synthase